MKHRLIVGSDDAGLKYKNAILEDLQNDPRASSVQDVGVNNDDPTACTYGEISIKAAKLNSKRRILICGSFSVEQSILSNNCQALTFGQRVIGLQLAREWLGYAFDKTSPSKQKIEKITEYELAR